jgi:ribonuclease HII
VSRRALKAGRRLRRQPKPKVKAKAAAGQAAERPRPHLEHETRLLGTGRVRRVAGIDEAGRGPLAGPVVAAAVVLPAGFTHALLNDSKVLLPAVRAAIYAELTTNPAVAWAFAIVDSVEIDRLNILRATHEAMRRAFAALPCRPEHVLIDGRPVHPFPVEHTALVDGDAISLSIAAASVIAKVTRDRLMVELDAQYPVYGFAQHKGYATREHLAILARDGPCPIHRFSFSPMAQPVFPFVELGRRARPTAVVRAQG